MEAKIEDGKLLIEWYRHAGEPVYHEVEYLDRTTISLIQIIGDLQTRIAALESRLAIF